MDLYQELCRILGEDNVLKDEPMSRHTTFRVGGPADLFVTPEEEGQVQKALLENPACWDLYRSFVDFAPLEETAAAWKELLAEGVPTAMATLAPQAEAAQKALSGGTALTALEEAALALAGALEKTGALCAPGQGRSAEFYVTDEPENFSTVAELFLGHSVEGTRVDITFD